VAEALLQRNVHHVVCAVDLSNCFNDLDRDELVAECLRHRDVPAVAALARYVLAMTVPPFPPSLTTAVVPCSIRTAWERTPTSVWTPPSRAAGGGYLSTVVPAECAG
jgi:hypothetical protein